MGEPVHYEEEQHMKEWGLNLRPDAAMPALTVAQYDALMDYWEESGKTFDTDEAVLTEKLHRARELLLGECWRRPGT